MEPTAEELTRRLVKTLIGIVILSILLFGSFSFFAPKVGYFFGFFSKHKFDPDDPTIIKPNPPIFANMPKSSKNDEISVNGYAQPGVTVIIYLNGPESGKVIAGADGTFSFSNLKLIDGNNTLFARVLSQNNVESEPSTTFTIAVDKEKPKLEITSPKDGDTIKNLDKRIEITGKVNEKCSIKVNNRIAVLKPDHTFEFLLGVEEGNIAIKIEATDEAGNVTDKTIRVKYEKSSN